MCWCYLCFSCIFGFSVILHSCHSKKKNMKTVKSTAFLYYTWKNCKKKKQKNSFFLQCTSIKFCSNCLSFSLHIFADKCKCKFHCLTHLALGQTGKILKSNYFNLQSVGRSYGEFLFACKIFSTSNNTHIFKVPRSCLTISS